MTTHSHLDQFSLPDDDEPLDDSLRALVAQADSHPTLRPSRDLWPGIAARLDTALPPAGPVAIGADPSAERAAPDGADSAAGARVLAFRTHRTPDAHPAPHVARPAMSRRWLAAAAVALVAVSSGATFLATRRMPTHEPAPPAATLAAGADAAPAHPVTGGTPTPDAPPAATPTQVAVAGSSDPTRETTRGNAADDESTRPLRTSVRTVSRAVDAAVPGAVEYDREIAGLRAVVAERPGDLDSATVEVLTRNLRIIDAAIAASRAALARDPHSPFLGEQLTRALGQKVDLLRTAALLPRT